MLFSVIVPLYNKADFIEATLRSALDQRCRDIEVIVVDDGSTDDGPQRVAAVGDRRVRLLRQANSGVSVARNLGIREAAGDYLAFLDADDYWTPGYLSAIAEMIGRFPGCGMYATHFYYFHGDRFRRVPKLPRIGSEVDPRRIDLFFEAWGRAELFYTSSVAIPARILRDSGIGFPEGEQNGEDLDVWFRIAERWPVAYLAQPLVGYRVGVPGSLVMSHPEDVPPCMDRLRTRYRSRAIAPLHRRGVRRVLGVGQLNTARVLLRRGMRRRAIKLLLDPMCLQAPRYWLRVLLAACMPALLGRRLAGGELDLFRFEGEA